MTMRRLSQWMFCVAMLAAPAASAQDARHEANSGEVHLHLLPAQPGKHRTVPVVVWLQPEAGSPSLPFPTRGHYTLLQKNRMFTPHLQVIPVGSVVQFPNADPFFHNVFSLFDGRRFDLGLYEAGSSRAVTFSREGVSYIFCNIHPEMSAVVLALSTPLYAVEYVDAAFVIHDVPPGDYKLNFWVEGVPQPTLDGLSRHVHVPLHPVDLGDVSIPVGKGLLDHTNKFGGTYDRLDKSTY
jgi:plastocyanin